ncbi:hypothetical protein MHM582_2080 [Microbacterium sp. HM58-2]|nr:hypothetical protein MHM582_2080 [Microbacterium sp. HM58-2]
MSEVVEVKTIGEVERIVHASGMFDGATPIEFSDDGVTWSETWSPSEGIEHPTYARVDVYRKDVRLPAAVRIRWDEQYPAASAEWAAAWDHAQMRHFGRAALMVGFRRSFRDLLGDVRLEDEAAALAVDAETVRDWAAEIADAKTIEQLDAVDADARAVRAYRATKEGTALHMASKARRRKLAAAEWETPPIAVEVAVPDVAASVPDEEITTLAEAVDQARRAPQDHLPPANRAERRKAARKKGGKR